MRNAQAQDLLVSLTGKHVIPSKKGAAFKCEF